jgi:hypothetical protein
MSMPISKAHPVDALAPASPRAQAAIAVALAALMICTRGQHFASVDALPSASWAVFFLVGALLRPVWALPLFFALSTSLDLLSLASGTISDWCLSPAYWALAVAYTVLWFGGRTYARGHRDATLRESWRFVPRLALVLLVTASVAYLVSKGGFHFFSGRHPEPTFVNFVARIPRYYPPALGTLAGYVGIAMLVRLLCRAVASRLAANAGARS